MIKWIRGHKLFVIVTSVIFALCLLISASYINGGFGKLGSVIQSANGAVQKPISAAASGTEKGIKGIFGFRSVLKENEALKEQVLDLERQLSEAKLSDRELEELRELSKALNYDAAMTSESYVTANIVAMDGANYYNIFTIDRGTETGISEDDIVISGEGLVGRILESGKGYSKVISVIDETSKVSFRTLRDMDVMGIVSGDGNGNLKGYTFDSEAPIIDEDVLVTSGLGIFPQGIEIGTVASSAFNQDSQLKTIEVIPKVRLNQLTKVMVLI